MKVESVVVAVDGESKCGTTTVINAIAEEARYQGSIIPNMLLDPDNPLSALFRESEDELRALYEHTFSKIAAISGGNVFRAAALQVALLECLDETKVDFIEDDYDDLRILLAMPGINNVLQSDPNIRSRVSEVAQLPGVQAVCGEIICDFIAEAYHAEGGGNLVIVDARDPVGHMRRNGLLGSREGQINPGHILPIYIDTPAEIAAERMPGGYTANLEEVRYRRWLDASREELPVVKPGLFAVSVMDWFRQFWQQREEVALPLYFDNEAGIDLDHIQRLAGWVAAGAHDMAISRDYDYSQYADVMADVTRRREDMLK